MRSISAGDETAFAELYDMTHAYLYSVALRIINSSAQADEVLQDAYLCIWQQARRFDPRLGSAMTWLIVIVRNQAISTLRGQRIEHRSLSLGEVGCYDEYAEQSSELADPIEQAFYASASGRLAAALARLEPLQRQAITLTFAYGMAHAELSAHMQVPLGTVKSWVRRGMARLGEYIQANDAGARPASDRLGPVRASAN
ncbi:sigma-70 family RNA polymerase sigma factor [Duganella sp. FT94W]|uniref:RNA polymerase sigma factor n=1 Tax=Duganella lactea TaxID=2692173 RepID=A0ABW9V7X1_9BURK|nr:sigma-70 family RNA polymerase sigma factor [Duganella lactea]MYM35759.1 sigma-70 family RNA polymerase sigma factor [Duganella lactea]